jgi:large subunit ribosomal protein L15
MPLARRIPKRGFNNITFEKAFQVVNVRDLNRYKNGAKVDFGVLLKDRLISRKCRFIKLLGNGELKKKINIVVHKASASAVQAVEKAGGKVELIS